MPDAESSVSTLEKRLGANWTALRQARATADERRAHLEQLFAHLNSSDSGLVVFGSVARGEVTSSSDLDWILLIDGQTFPEQTDLEREIERKLAENKIVQPGASGVFGCMVGGHDLVHNIGGEDDLNSNLTRRVLLLLESLPIKNSDAYVRVRRQILRRYLTEDRGLIYGRNRLRVPRFLLNDFTRYWRTITVDFVYKQRSDKDKKWALRNAKLRLSRKLIFASGLLTCLFCQLDVDATEAREALKEKDLAPLTRYLERMVSMSPLEKLAKVCIERSIASDTARQIFGCYDRFVAILDDQGKREELAQVRDHADLRKSQVWREVQDVSHPFHEALVSLFLREDEELGRLTMEYGIF
jgi:predicted nucleotidyltransferase